MSSRDNHRSSASRVVCAMSVCWVTALVVANAADKSKDGDTPPPRYEAEVLWAEGGPEGVSGQVLYQAHCSSCHKSDGTGFRAMFPPLANSNYFAENPRRLLAVVMEGLSGPITVNGAHYDQIMPPINYLSNKELALLLTYVLNRWNNPGGEITAEDVEAYRKAAGLD